MNTKLIIFMMTALIGSLQASEHKQTMQFIPFQPEIYTQPGDMKSHVSKQLDDYNKDIRHDGYQMAALCRAGKMSVENVSQVMVEARLSPNFGVAAQFSKGVSDNCRMSSPTYIHLKTKCNEEGVTDEQKKECKRAMHRILNT